MTTHLPGFQSFFIFFVSFCIGKIRQRLLDLLVTGSFPDQFYGSGSREVINQVTVALCQEKIIVFPVTV